MKKLKFSYINYNRNDFLNLDYYDFVHIKKYWYNEINFSEIEKGSYFNNYYNYNKDYSINNDKYYKSLIRFINYINNNFYNISFSINRLNDLRVFIIDKRKRFKTFKDYWKDRKYFKLYKQLRENKKNFDKIDLFNNFICKKTRYDKYFWLYRFKKEKINSTLQEIENKNLNILKLSYDNRIITKDQYPVKNTNRIIFYKNWIGLYNKDWKLFKTFTYKNNINILNYVKL